MNADLSHPRFALRSGETWADPWPMYAALRDSDPVHHVVPDNPQHDYWVLSRHADIWSAARDQLRTQRQLHGGFPPRVDLQKNDKFV